ncbi:MAG: SulP family inorganic anion transporter [Bacteroidia bacterium]|nr:SulP family inorganic anion transporter [Bacteroidia bacterium]
MKKIPWGDFRSGLVVFLVALPLCLGIAMACDVPPEAGLWSGIIGGVAVTIFSGSRLSVSGPAAGLISIIIAGIASVKSMDHFFLAVSLAGALQIIMRILNMGQITVLIPNAVIYGMLSGVGIIIILKQIPHLIGYDPDFEGDMTFSEFFGSNTFQTLYDAFIHLQDGPMIIGLSGLTFLIIGDKILEKKFRFFKIIPISLCAVLIGVTLVYFFNHQQKSIFFVHDENRIQLPAGHQSLRFLTFDFSTLTNFAFWKMAFTIGIVATLESLLCIEAVDKLDPEKRVSDKNKELVAQGIGNIFCGLFCALPVTSVIVRSSANIYAGAKTKLSSIVHGIYLLIAIYTLSDFINLIPKASLAAILIMVGFKLNKPELYMNMVKSGARQYIPFFVTLMVMIFTDLLTGVLAGCLASLLFIVHTLPSAQIKISKRNKTISVRLPEYVTFLHKLKLKKIREKIKSRAIVFDESKCRYIDPDCMEIIHSIKSSSSSEIN